MYVDITSRGDPSAGVLKEGDILPAARTISPVQIGNVLDVLDGGTRANVSVILSELSKGLDDRGQDLKWAFTQLSPFLKATRTLSTALDERRANLARLVTNFGGITSELAEHDKQLQEFVESGDATLAELDDNDSPFRATMAELPPTLTQLDRSFENLRQTEDVLDPALHSLAPVADALPSGLKALGSFATSATPALNALRPVAQNLRPLAAALRPTAQDLSTSFIKLRKEAPSLDRFTKEATLCLPQLSDVLNSAMSFTKFGDVNDRGQQVADARADVRIDFTTAGRLTRDPSWTVQKPCNMKGTGR
jgi:phospholipid/cholesterol/gamma-HCH transport system substrate-binding protein